MFLKRLLMHKIRGSYASATSSTGCRVGVKGCTKVDNTEWDLFSGMLGTKAFIDVWIFGILGPLAEKL
jgi:hypothetical protein